MTSHEIYGQLGAVGTLIALFNEMGATDGNFDPREFSSLQSAAENYTEEDIDPIWDKVLEIRSEILPSGMINYLKEILPLMAKSMDDDTKRSILVDLKDIAEADGNVNTKEVELFQLVASILVG